MDRRAARVCMGLVLVLLVDPAKGQNAQWLEVFSTIQGAGQTVMDAWNAAAGVEVSHHKCPIVEQWSSLTIKRVKIVLEASDGNKEFIFNGENSGKTDWFTRARLISSPYNDIMTDPINYFSVEGLNDAQRRFYISRNHGGCGNDRGWLVVADAGPSGICNWERASTAEHPHVLYSKLSTSVRWDDTANVGKADRLVIYIEGDNVRCDPAWLDVFSTVKGTGQTVYDAWSAPAGTAVLHNKCPVLEFWDSLTVKRVKITLEASDGDKKFIFDGLGSDKNSWFSKSRLISSPYTDISTEPQNVFSITGDNNAQRRFYINRNYNSCPGDRGWLVVADGGPSGICSWERASTSEHPHVLYSKQSTNVVWDDAANVGKADRLLISIDADGVVCSCPVGYTFNSDGTSCDDIDECTAGTDNCGSDATCSNTVGSFTCACNSGYTGNGVTCADIDECTAGTHNCGSDATCSNTVGGFTCACNSGYTGNGVTCADIDECTAGTHNCGSDATCSNTVGGFTCACNSGYSGDGITCTDINGCDSNPCDTSNMAICADVPAPGTGATCTCPPGYWGDGLSSGTGCTGCASLYPALVPASNFGVYQGKCFWSSDARRHKQRETYAAALKVCRDNGGTLIMLKDRATQTFILNHLKDKRVRGRKERRFWMGLDDLNAEKVFLWNDGTPLGGHNSFKSTAPHKERDCVTLWKPQKRVPRWYIKDCDMSYPYICQFGGGGYK
ncbi:HMCN1 [Branchiostoma lanceolatum]|uniref:HMCN1 protein n=1 Tax=Branchiostoma lanceolatum TaxID=7740 RepID=A0A8J9VJI9_BRALA|nr:HMCN1 [Branchiostoma lanceolatum]CAH1238944.1 HMCN1 [Branchiostoma lanceolatum]